MLSLRIARAAYGSRTVLRDVALDVAPGEIVGVAGAVGAGKTTLALAAAGLLDGAVPGRVTGDIRYATPSRPAAAFVFSNPWTQLTELGGDVTEEVAVGPENQGVPSDVIRERVARALRLADAESLAARAPRELSGGELQRVALASALALDTRLLVLDEPTAQLDPESARRLVTALRELTRRGVGVLLIEQNLELLRETADRVFVLAGGSVAASGDPTAVLNRWPPIDARLGVPADVLDREAPRSHPLRPGAALLEIDDVIAGYGAVDVLRGASMRIPAGAVCAWLGANGAGKSTLARVLVGLVPARAGRVRVSGTVLDAMPTEQRARWVGLVFQDPSRQLFARRVIDEAAFGPRAMGVPRPVAHERAREALAAVGLDDRRNEHPGDLAPQLQRRLAIAAALATRAPLLVLDEPTAGQDAAGREWIARALELQRTRGAAAVITHDLAFARRECEFAVTIAHGRVSDGGTDVAPERRGGGS